MVKYIIKKIKLGILKILLPNEYYRYMYMLHFFFNSQEKEVINILKYMNGKTPDEQLRILRRAAPKCKPLTFEEKQYLQSTIHPSITSRSRKPYIY